MMQLILQPGTAQWAGLCRRPAAGPIGLHDSVADILSAVRREGDAAVRRFTAQFDGVQPEMLRVSDEEIAQAGAALPEPLKAAIAVAAANIRRFHESQLHQEPVVETMPGVRCWRRSLPIGRVGLYIPGGSAPLFSSVLMLAIPAAIAGCGEVLLCTPPGKEGRVHPAILYAAAITGVTQVYKIGGAQAIAAMAWGTESVPAVDKIFGPGNAWVTCAKQLVQQAGVAIDMPAGPSEVLVIADESANPEFVAADLLSQAEHGPDSQVMLLSNSAALAARVQAALTVQLAALPRQAIAEAALQHSRAIVLDSLQDCMAFSNLYAPEHLILNTSNAMALAGQVQQAGSVFIGPWSCESAGDYASGTNHTLPTNGYARSYSGVSVDSFVKKISFQELDEQGIRNLGPVIECMAEAEQLAAHREAVSIRLKALN